MQRNEYFLNIKFKKHDTPVFHATWCQFISCSTIKTETHF